MAEYPLIELRGITKRFAAVVANDDVSLTVHPGEVRGIVGENGAGKSTLMAIASGLYRPDEGQILIDGEERHFRSPTDAIDAGVNMVYQRFMLVRTLTVAENIVLGLHGSRTWLNLRQVEDELRDLGEQYGLPVDPRARVADLTPGMQQRVEILAALRRGSRVLILDEPTSVLAPAEAEQLFERVQSLAESGRGVLFISHKLDEILALCDRISVMRGGKLRLTVERSEADAHSLATAMVGRELEDLKVVRRKPEDRGDPVLEVRDLRFTRRTGSGEPSTVDLEVRAGEILGIAGVEGNGQTELVETLSGNRPPEGGQILVDGEELDSADARREAERRIAYVPDDAREAALLPEFSVAWNIGLRHYRTGSALQKVDFSRLRELAASAIEEFEIHGATPDTPVGILSGGNLHKVLLARELGLDARLLLIMNPTAGLDIGAATSVHAALVAARDKGAAILLVSTELDEIQKLSDRIAVMHGGEIIETLENDGVGRSQLGLLMGGIRGESPASEGENA